MAQDSPEKLFFWFGHGADCGLPIMSGILWYAIGKPNERSDKEPIDRGMLEPISADINTTTNKFHAVIRVINTISRDQLN